MTGPPHPGGPPPERRSLTPERPAPTELPVVSVVSVTDRGGGLHAVVLRLPDGQLIRMITATAATDLTTVRVAASVVLALWGLGRLNRQGQ